MDATASVEPGRIIILNGPSSSGKSTIAAELLAMLDPPHFLMSVDSFNALRSRDRTAMLDDAALDEVLRRTRLGFHRAIAGMAAGGNYLIVDHVLSEAWRLVDCLRVLDGFAVIFVGVHCERRDLIRREQNRGDRPQGLAESQLTTVHAHCKYDIEVDTSHNTARECARQITEVRAHLTGESAFDRLRRTLVG